MQHAQAQVTRHRLRGTGYKVQVTRYRIRGTYYEVQVTRYRLRGTGYKVQVTRHRFSPRPPDIFYGVDPAALMSAPKRDTGYAGCD